jgi:hypothetical protein
MAPAKSGLSIAPWKERCPQNDVRYLQ